jgi:hypothetical protein
MNEADLSDDAIIELAREGGVAWIPTLSGMRKIIVLGADYLDAKETLVAATWRIRLPRRLAERQRLLQYCGNSGEMVKAALAINRAQIRRVFSKSVRGRAGRNNPPRRRPSVLPAADGSPGSGPPQQTPLFNASRVSNADV